MISLKAGGSAASSKALSISNIPLRVRVGEVPAVRESSGVNNGHGVGAGCLAEPIEVRSMATARVVGVRPNHNRAPANRREIGARRRARAAQRRRRNGEVSKAFNSRLNGFLAFGE